MAERGYGWEKLMSEMFCQEYWAERGLKTFIARFHNVYGPWGTWDGGREKAPAAICRKVIEAKDHRATRRSTSGATARRRAASCTSTIASMGIDRIMHCDELIATPINLGSSEMVSINELVDMVEEIAAIKLARHYDLTRRAVSPGATATTPSSSRCSAGSRTQASDRVNTYLFMDIREQLERRAQGEAVVRLRQSVA